MSEQELNKKLAEWRFPPPEYRVVRVYEDFIAIDKKYNDAQLAYLKSEGIKDAWYRCENIDILTQSLDACFKWLVPKLSRWEIRNFKPYVVTYLKPRAKVAHQSNGKWYEGKAEAETPALALCEAIEKLVDELS